MHWTSWGFFGMHLFWWAFWIVLLIALASYVGSASKGKTADETPLDVLQRRYASGEIDTPEYEERKAELKKAS